MARGINKVILIGNLGNEPLCRTTHTGTSVTNISMVTNEVRRNMETGETTEYAEWHRVVMWGRLADIAKQYLHKGSQVYIEGKLRTRTYMDKQGQNRSITEIVADEMQMLGRAPGAQGGGMGNGYNQAPRAQDGYGNSGYGQNNAYGQNNYNANPYQAGGYNNGGYNNNNANPSSYNNNAYGSNYANAGMNATAYGQAADPYNVNKQPSADLDAPFDEAAPSANPYPQPTAAAPVAPADSAAPAEAKTLAEPAIKMSDDEIPF